MDGRERPIMLVAAVVLLLVAAATSVRPHAVAQSGYTLTWWTVDGGGGTFSTGGAYTLGGTIGQPDAGQLTGGTYTLGGGFWGGGAAAIHYDLYLPLVVRQYP